MVAKQSERTPAQSLCDLAPPDLPPTMRDAAKRCRTVRVGDEGWPTWDDIHRNVMERHYLHSWPQRTLAFAVVMDDFFIAAVAVFGIGSIHLPASLHDGWTWVDKDRGGQVLELKRMMAQPWAPKGMVSWFLRRCQMGARAYYPKLRAIVVYVAPGAVDTWTGEPKAHSGKTYAAYCRARRLPDTGSSTEYAIKGVHVSRRSMSKIRYGSVHMAGGELVTDADPDEVKRVREVPKRRFIWFENCDPRQLRLKKPVITYEAQPEPVEEIISYEYGPTEWEVESRGGKRK